MTDPTKPAQPAGDVVVPRAAVSAIEDRLNAMLDAIKSVADALPDSFIEANAGLFENLCETMEACSTENLDALAQALQGARTDGWRP